MTGAGTPAATAPGRYRRKPAEVEAYRVQTGNLAEVAAWCDGVVYDENLRWDYDSGAVVMPDGTRAHVKYRAWGVVVRTPGGDRTAEFGDWITRSANGAFRVYDTVSFGATYEPVPDGDA